MAQEAMLLVTVAAKHKKYCKQISSCSHWCERDTSFCFLECDATSLGNCFPTSRDGTIALPSKGQKTHERSLNMRPQHSLETSRTKHPVTNLNK